MKLGINSDQVDIASNTVSGSKCPQLNSAFIKLLVNETDFPKTNPSYSPGKIKILLFI